MKCPFCFKIFSSKEANLRTIPENKYYFKGIVEILSDELGYTPVEIHEILKVLFLTELKILKTKNGTQEVRITKSTAGLTIPEFEEYLSQIRIWASSDLGIWLPMPNEKLNERMES